MVARLRFNGTSSRSYWARGAAVYERDCNFFNRPALFLPRDLRPRATSERAFIRTEALNDSTAADTALFTSSGVL